jgi:hypothetical protein
MPDDPPRPVSGQQSDPRPAAGAPAWWGALGRPDLPLDSDATPPPVRPAPAAHTRRERPVLPAKQVRWRGWAFNIAVLAVAVLIVCVGVGVVSPRMFVTTALIFGVPISLAAITAVVMARRSR